MKQMIEIDVPDGYEIEGVMSQQDNCSKKILPSIYWCSYTLRLRPAWQWPDWLTAEWIAMDESGRWWAYEHEPQLGRIYWNCATEDEEMFEIVAGFTSFSPPPCFDWKLSKRRNPMLKVTT